MNWLEVKRQSLCRGETGQRCWERAFPSLPGMKCYICSVIAVAHTELVVYIMQKHPHASSSVQSSHPVPRFLSCTAFAVAASGRRLELEVESLYVPKFTT